MKDEMRELMLLKAQTIAEIGICEEQIKKLSEMSIKFQKKIQSLNKVLGNIEATEEFGLIAKEAQDVKNK